MIKVGYRIRYVDFLCFFFLITWILYREVALIEIKRLAGTILWKATYGFWKIIGMAKGFPAEE